MSEPRPLIAVVDDDLSFREALAGFLRSWGYAAAEFSSGVDFLADPGLDDCELVLLDMQMPAMDGLTVQDQLRRRGRATRIVFVTACNDAAAKAQALAAGAEGFLDKPCRFEDLMAHLSGAAALPAST